MNQNRNDHDSIAAAHLHETLGIQAIAQRDYPRAENHLLLALGVKTRLQQRLNIATVDIGLIHNHLGTVRRAMDKYREAAGHFDLAWSIYLSHYGEEFELVTILYDLYVECIQSAEAVDNAAHYPTSAQAA